MAAPSYTTDLTVISQADEASGTWAEPTATGWGQIGTIGFQETDFPLQGATTLYCMSGTVKTGVGGLLADAGASGITIPTDGAVLTWIWFSVPGLLDTSNSIRAVIGSGLSDFYWTAVLVKADYTYGGWRNVACADPSAISMTSQGSPTSTRRYFGWAYAATFAGSLKGNPYGVDVIRYGRCEARMNGGEAANYATFAGFAAANDATTARWGLIQSVSGGYLWKGLITLGYSSAVDFRDSNVLVLIDYTPKVTSNFNKIEIRQSGSRVDWTNIAFICTAPSTTASKGKFECIDNADVNILNCSFTDMDTFIFQSASSILTSTFRRCGQITAAGANFSGSIFDSYTGAADTSQLVWNVATNPDGYLDNTSFTKGTNAHHAIELGLTSPTDITLRGITFSGFNANNSQQDSAIHVKRTTGNVTISAVGCSGTVSYKSDGAAVSVSVDPITVQVTAKTAGGTVLENVLVYLKASDGTGPFPYQESVSIVNSGTLATVTHTGHGMDSNDYVLIEGASLAANNGVFQITKTSDDVYTYTMGSTPGSNPTGTITATFVALFGNTNSSGIKSTSRVYSSDQPVTGWARKSSSSPYYKTAVIIDNVDSVNGLSATAIMLLDT